MISSAVRGQGVFAVLPTGFGKSFCFSVLPYVHDQLFPGHGASIVLVITPSTARSGNILKNYTFCSVLLYILLCIIKVLLRQVASLRRRGLSCCYISVGKEEDAEGVKNGSYIVVFFTPEMLLERRWWRNVLLGEVYSPRLWTVANDEAHIVNKWYV